MVRGHQGAAFRTFAQCHDGVRPERRPAVVRAGPPRILPSRINTPRLRHHRPSVRETRPATSEADERESVDRESGDLVAGYTLHPGRRHRRLRRHAGERRRRAARQRRQGRLPPTLPTASLPAGACKPRPSPASRLKELVITDSIPAHRSGSAFATNIRTRAVPVDRLG